MMDAIWGQYNSNSTHNFKSNIDGKIVTFNKDATGAVVHNSGVHQKRPSAP
jgi:hypothetical protein